MKFSSFAAVAAILLLICAVYHPAESTPVEVPLAQCGGEISGDAGNLSYPDTGSLTPGEVCVFVVHLETLRDFRMDISNLDIHSNYLDCRDGGIRIYSISNLVPEGNIESYTFCDQKPSESTFFLGSNIAVIVVYSAPTNSNPGSGFSLSWEGVSFDPMRTQHISTFSSAAQGIIKYPVVSQYDPSLAATWLVKTGATRPDFDLRSVDLEPCANVNNPCTCDALLLYEINESGVLAESRRYCYGGETDDYLPSIESRFLVAFFSDFETLGGGALGFDSLYAPPVATSTVMTSSTTITPTTTTTPRTTVPTVTTTQWNDPSTPCGTIIHIDESNPNGTISYKDGSLYQPNERCIWIIRVASVSNMAFRMQRSGISGSDWDDAVYVSGWSRVLGGFYSGILRLEGESANFGPSSVHVIIFHSDAASQGLGFILEYSASSFEDTTNSENSVDFLTTDEMGSIQHPSDSPNYSDEELSIFLLSPPGFSASGSPLVDSTWTNRGLDGSSTYGDTVEVLLFQPTTGPTHWREWDLMTWADTSFAVNNADMVMYVFRTDRGNTSEGFTIHWSFD